jgi:hypothetical protein
MPAGQLTGQQTATKDYLVFSDFETMDTHVARQAMAPNRLAWCENLQLIGSNQLTAVPGPNAPIANIAGKTASKMWFGFMLGIDYEFVFETDGSLQAVNVATGVVTQVAGPGTFSNPDLTVWQSSVLLIADAQSGYSAWNGTAFSKAGGVSPNIVVTNGGSGYASGANVGISAVAGIGAAATVTAPSGSVTALTLTSGGLGYSTATVAIIGALGVGQGATATATVVAGAITALAVTNGGNGYVAANPIYVSGAGIGCFATATVAAGVITALTVTSGGSGYISGAAVVLTPTVGSGATATAVVVGGSVTSLNLTAGGSGYATSGNQVLIQGGPSSGGGATATAQTLAGVVIGVTLTNAGANYAPTDTVIVTITPVAGGSGATATARVFPQFGITPTTLAVFSGRVWLGGGRQLTWTGVGGFDDAALADASGSTMIPDSDLVHRITALRSLNNFLWIFGDNSIKQIGTVSVSGSTTVFSIVTLSSDTGTIFPQTIVSYNRLVLFANATGVYAVLGSSVQKISEEMDGIFRSVDFTIAPCAALNDINSIRCYLLLVRYIDPLQARTRTLLLTFQSKKWFVCSQGDNLRAMATAVINGTLETFASSGADITQILQNPVTPVSIFLQTALAHHNKPHMGKRALRAATAQTSSSTATMNMTIDTENGSVPQPYTVAFTVIWLNALNQVVNWLNSLSQFVTFSGSGFLWQRTPAAGTGIFLGISLRGSFSGYSFNYAVIEYQDATALASQTSV